MYPDKCQSSMVLYFVKTHHWRFAALPPACTKGPTETTFSEVAAAFLQRCAEVVKSTRRKYATPDAGEIWKVVRDVQVPYKEYMDIDTAVCDKRICI